MELEFNFNGDAGLDQGEVAHLVANCQAEVDQLDLPGLLGGEDAPAVEGHHHGGEVSPGGDQRQVPDQGGLQGYPPNPGHPEEGHAGAEQPQEVPQGVGYQQQATPPESKENRIRKGVRSSSKKRKAYQGRDSEGANPGAQAGGSKRRDQVIPWSIYSSDPNMNASLREQIELKLRVKLMPKPSVAESHFERPPCCFAKVRNRHLLHTRTCVVSKEEIWLGHAEEACPLGYMALLNDDPEKVLRPFTKTHQALYNLCTEIRTATKHYVSEGDKIWKSFSMNSCGSHCFREEILQMSACVAMIMRSDAKATNYHQLAQLHRVWIDHEDLGRDFVSKIHACSRRGQEIQVHCGLPNFAQNCATQRLRRDIVILQKQAMATEQGLRKRVEEILGDGLPHLQTGILNSLMHGYSQNQQRFEQLYWLLFRRRAVLRFPDLSLIILQGGEAQDSFVPAVVHGFAKVPSLEDGGMPGEEGECSGESSSSGQGNSVDGDGPALEGMRHEGQVAWAGGDPGAVDYVSRVRSTPGTGPSRQRRQSPPGRQNRDLREKLNRGA